MKRTGVLLFCLALAAGTRASAQGPQPGLPTEPGWTRGLIHYGKWATAATALVLTARGAREHSHSAREWDQLIDLCRADNQACVVGADGRYVNPVAEQHYQGSIAFDRRAHGWLLGGQASLIVTAALFVADLRHHTNGPDNIPIQPLEVSADPATRATRVGLRFAF